MADESPPPKKIGSLRDRIAAFEKQSSASTTPSNPPPTRPKPGNVSWKPKQPSPPPSPSNKDKDRASSAKSTMSATDAKESIGQGISLKERMAALQGKGGFGPANPPPKPATEKPKWKPPPKPVSPPSPSEEKPPVDFEAVVRSPPVEAGLIETPGERTSEPTEQGDEAGETKEDPEEEERQRRAAIAARMQRLGGARIGMAPPVIAAKPPIRRSSVQKEEETKTEVASPSPLPEDVSKESGEVERKGSDGFVDGPAGTDSTYHKPPTSMPIPAAPRRAAPPRRKKEIPKTPEEPPAPSQEEETAVPEVKIPPPESTPNLADAEGEETEVQTDVDLKPTRSTEPSPPTNDEYPELPEDSGPVTETTASPPLAKSGDHDVPEDAHLPSSSKEDQPVSPSQENVLDLVEEGQKEIEERSGIDQPEQNPEEPPSEAPEDEGTTERDPVAEGEDEPNILTKEPDVAEDKPEERLDEEEDETARRARIADRLAKSGGFNPFAGGPPARKPSEGSLPERRTSFETSAPFKRTLHEEQEPTAQPLARDIDSPHDETGSPTTEPKEEDKPYDTLKRVEGDDRELDENGKVDDGGVTGDNVGMEPARVPPPPPFVVPPPPPLISRPPAQPAPDPITLAEASIPMPPPNPPSSRPIPSQGTEERPDYPDAEPGPPPPLPPSRPSAAHPLPPTAPRPIPSRSRAETGESSEVASRDSEEYEEAPSTASFDLPRYTDTTSHQGNTSKQDPPEKEVLADEDGDPIDPGFIPSRSPSIKAAKPPAEPPKPPREGPVPESAPEEEDEEQARKKRLAERMAKLGGIRFGGPPPMGVRPPPKVEREAEEGGEEKLKEEGPEEEEDEQARRQRIAAKLAGMGGMRIGMVPGAIPPKPSRKDSANIGQPEPRSPPPPVRPPPPPAQPPPSVRSDTGNMSEDDVVKVEMEESEAEEVDYHDVGEEIPPPIPSRTARPPIPGPGNLRKGSVDSAPFPLQNTAPSRAAPPTPSEYVMVEEPDISDQSAPPPPSRASRPPRAPPPPPASADIPDNMIMSQWELPPIPSSTLDMEASVADLSTSSWSETFDTEETSQEKAAEDSSKERRQSGGQMTADQLMTVWGRVGIQVCEAAVQLFEKSKKTLVGDGSYVGFVNAVLDVVPNASTVEEDASSFGYPIYTQTGSSVTKRAADIMPGDIIVLQDVKLKGHKGIQTYHQNVGEGAPVVAIIGEYEPRKSKVKAYQASQHVGNQTVETISYRLEDLKSGSIKIFRVLES